MYKLTSPVKEQKSSGTKIVDDPMIFTGPVEFQKLPKIYVDKFGLGATTVSVVNLTALTAANTVATHVTDFINGINGQTIRILGDGFTTVVNSAKLKTNTGANKLLAANKVYTFTRFNNVWVEAA